MNIKKQFTEGLITNNPVLVQRIGMCSTMAITTTLFNGIGMGLSVLVILTCCNIVISAMRKVIPNDIRLAIFVVVIAGFVTIVDLLLQAFPAKVVAAPREGSFSAHIRRAVGEQEVLDPEGLQLELLGGVTLRQTADGVEILAGEKKLLKTGQNYAIIKQEACDAVLSPNGIWLREGPGMGVFDTLQQNPVLKIEWQATSV